MLTWLLFIHETWLWLAWLGFLMSSHDEDVPSLPGLDPMGLRAQYCPSHKLGRVMKTATRWSKHPCEAPLLPVSWSRASNELNKAILSTRVTPQWILMNFFKSQLHCAALFENKTLKYPAWTPRGLGIFFWSLIILPDDSCAVLSKCSEVNTEVYSASRKGGGGAPSVSLSRFLG